MIRLKNVCRKYDGLAVLNNLSLDIAPRKTTVLLGPSGCGKTTLLDILAGLDIGFTGNVSGIPENARISFCFQEDRLLEWADVKSNVEFVLGDRKKDKTRALRFIEMMELERYLKFKAGKLSGGMRQRVSIARSLAFPSGILLMDEPFRSLDHALKERIIGRLNLFLRGEKRTAVVVTHDLNDALLVADIICVLSDKPYSVLKKINIAAPKEKRDLKSRTMVSLKKEILKAMG